MFGAPRCWHVAPFPEVRITQFLSLRTDIPQRYQAALQRAGVSVGRRFNGNP